MGVGFNFICNTCRKYYTLGYGSYRTWIFANSLEEYNKAPDCDKSLPKNKNLKSCLSEHNGHDTELLNMDYTIEREGRLYDEDPSPFSKEPERLIVDISTYQRIGEEKE